MNFILGDVKHIITDYGLGKSTVKGEGIHIKIGVSPIISDIPLTITSNLEPNEIYEKIGYCPLADSLIESIEAGCKIIYAMPILEATSGTITEKEKVFSGTGIISLEGKPSNEYTIKIEITQAGEKNIGIFKYYINDLESEEITIPISGQYEITSIGVTVKFSNGNYNYKDNIIFKTTKPKMDIQGILKALEYIKNSTINFEFIHIIGESNKTLWATISTQADIFFNTYYKPCIFVCETRDIKADETPEQYMEYLRNEKRGIVSRDLQVVCSRVNYMRQGKQVNINSASLIMGLHAKAKVQQSIGEVAVFELTGVLNILPQKMENYISELDDLGYTTLRTYSGIEGIYVNNSKTFAKTGSDFEYTELVRTMYKAVRETRKTALLKIHSQIDMSNPEKSLRAITEFINTPVEKMVYDKELSAARVIIPEGQDILATSTLKFKIRAVPIGILREIEINMGFENPMLKK